MQSHAQTMVFLYHPAGSGSARHDAIGETVSRKRIIIAWIDFGKKWSSHESLAPTLQH